MLATVPIGLLGVDVRLPKDDDPTLPDRPMWPASGRN
jgi:hypothetical protein